MFQRVGLLKSSLITAHRRTFFNTARMSSSIPQTQKALQINKIGGPEVLELNQIPVNSPGKGEVLIKNEYAGVNFIDTYFRSGIYPVQFPFTLGQEIAGTVVAIGEGIDPKEYGFNVGDKVGALCNGGYREYPNIPAMKVQKLPEGVSTKDACTVILQGLTAEMLIREYHPAKAGEYILVHACAGGMGLILCQMLKDIGVHVIGTASTAEKAQLAKSAGAEHVILYADRSLDDVAKDVKALTPDGKGVHAVYDGVGKDTFEMNMEVLKLRGSLVTYGNASGPVPPVAPLRLTPKGLKLSRPSLNNYFENNKDFQSLCKDLFDLVARGVVKAHRHNEEGYPFSLEGIKQAHDDITSRKTTGKLLVKI